MRGGGHPGLARAASYALSISAPVSRMTDERVRSLIPALLETRDEISACLGDGRNDRRRAAGQSV